MTYLKTDWLEPTVRWVLRTSGQSNAWPGAHSRMSVSPQMLGLWQPDPSHVALLQRPGCPVTQPFPGCKGGKPRQSAQRMLAWAAVSFQKACGWAWALAPTPSLQPPPALRLCSTGAPAEASSRPISGEPCVKSFSQRREGSPKPQSSSSGS